MRELRLADDYQQARTAFRGAAEAAGAEMEAHPHPLQGPGGEDLAVDVAVVGNPAADAALLIVSGTHGVEGFTGSELQRRWLEVSARNCPDEVRVVLIHAFNPHGFAWVRRVNEDNVDLNRNFIDWAKPPPANDDYANLAPLLVPDSWDEDTQQETTTELLAFAEREGFEQLQHVVSSGQFSHPTGVFYGGTGPVWSHRWMRENASRLLSPARRVGVVDLHTGLGPSGHGELGSSARAKSSSFQRATTWWGDVRSIVDGDSVSATLTGEWLARFDDFVPDTEITGVGLEYGTVDIISVLQALRADAVLHAHGDPAAPEAAAIRAQVRAAFADDDPRWIAKVLLRFDEVIAAALTNLASDG